MMYLLRRKEGIFIGIVNGHYAQHIPATEQPVCNELSFRMCLCSQVVEPEIEAHWVLWKDCIRAVWPSLYAGS